LLTDILRLPFTFTFAYTVLLATKPARLDAFQPVLSDRWQVARYDNNVYIRLQVEFRFQRNLTWFLTYADRQTDRQTQTCSSQYSAPFPWREVTSTVGLTCCTAVLLSTAVLGGSGVARIWREEGHKTTSK